jgi:hypothetical protein
MKNFLLFFGLMICFGYTNAQDCQYFPADCPDAGSIEAALSASVRSGNGLTKKEIEMQDQMRNLTTDMMQHAAKILGWQMIEIDEIVNLDPFQSAGTPAPLRSPRGFGIEFEFIVNKDSLKAWKDWLIDFSNSYQNATADYMNKQNDIANSPEYKQYTDSANKYLKLYTDYLTVHQDEGGSLFADKKLKYYLAKQKEYSGKQVALINMNSSAGTADTFDKEKAERTKHYRAESIVQVFFSFNDGVGIIRSEGGDVQVSNYNLPGAAYAKSVHLLEPDPNTIPWHFDQWENMDVLLFGKWLPESVQSKDYTAAFTLHGQADERTPKKISSDKIQTIVIHVMGNKGNMNKLIQQLNVDKLNAAIYKSN